jgi:phosphoribosylanthranilate isomerase
MSLWIKICANTSLEDALLAAEAGADALGFVFAPSPRRVTAAQVATIVPQLPAGIEKIGVFVDAAFDEIASAVKECALTGVQLHFDVEPELPAQLRARFGEKLRILRVVHLDAQHVAEEARLGSGHDFSRAASAIESGRALASEASFSDPNIDAILIDSRSTTAVGGTGLTFDWSAASQVLLQNAKARERRLVAAGGLRPDNVAEAIAILRPWGVDVVSGVEAAPGHKDEAKMRAFIAAARKAHEERSAIA